MDLKLSEALKLLEQGHCMQRAAWRNDRFIFAVAKLVIPANLPILRKMFPGRSEVVIPVHIDMKTIRGSIIPWTIYPDDLLTADWQIFD